MKSKEEKNCGECCWFGFEDTEGLGMCYEKYPDVAMCCTPSHGCEFFFDRKEMRHHMAVMLQWNRWMSNPALYRAVDYNEIMEATQFAYRYMSVMNKF